MPQTTKTPFEARRPRAGLTLLLGATALVSATAGAGAQVSMRVNRVLQVQATGTWAQNCEALRGALESITDGQLYEPYLVRLEPGRYDCGTVPVIVPVGVSIEGAGIGSTIITGEVDNLVLGVVHLISATALRSLSVYNLPEPALASIAVSVFSLDGGSQNVRIRDVRLWTHSATEPALATLDASVSVFGSILEGLIEHDGGAVSLHYTLLNGVQGTGYIRCAFSGNLGGSPLDADCNPL